MAGPRGRFLWGRVRNHRLQRRHFIHQQSAPKGGKGQIERGPARWKEKMSRDRMQSAIRSAIRVSVRSDALDVSKQFRDVQDNISLDVDNRFPDTHIHKDEHHGNDPRELSDQPSIVCETKHPVGGMTIEL